MVTYLRCLEGVDLGALEWRDFETRAWGESSAERLLMSPMGARAVEYGYASREDLEAMAAAFRAWAVRPDAFWAFIHVAALAKKS